MRGEGLDRRIREEQRKQRKTPRKKPLIAKPQKRKAAKK